MEDQPRSRRLSRSTDRRLGGVCGGIADYFDVDATLVRVGFVLLALFSMGVGALLAYGVLWAIMPEPDPAAAAPATPAGERAGGALLLGIALVVFGIAAIFQRLLLFWWWSGGMMHLGWPILLITAGVLIVVATRRR